jgi:hypothetical protein
MEQDRKLTVSVIRGSLQQQPHPPHPPKEEIGKLKI